MSKIWGDLRVDTKLISRKKTPISFAQSALRQKDGCSLEDLTWREARAPRCRSGGPLMILSHHPLSFIITTINKTVLVVFTIINNTIIVVIMILILEAP